MFERGSCGAYFLKYWNRRRTARTRDEILSVFWGYDCLVGQRSIDRLVTTLRNKISPAPHNPSFIHTIREIGYKFEPPELSILLKAMI